MNLCSIAKFEVKTYKNQKKGFTEVTASFHYKLAASKVSPRCNSLMVNQNNFPNQKLFSKTHFKPILHVYTPSKNQKI